MHRTRALAAFVGIAAMSFSAVACGDDEDEPTQSAATAAMSAEAASEAATTDAAMATSTAAMTDTAMAPDTAMATDTAATGTIVDIAAAAPDLSILVEAVEAAGLAETLSGDGPFTVLAPTNEAFEAALAALGLTKEQLLANENLADILKYHVLAGAVASSDIASEPSRTTVQGEQVEIASDGSVVTVNGSATVATPDVMASNGIVHVIDAVLLPPTIAAALGADGASSGAETTATSTGG